MADANNKSRGWGHLNALLPIIPTLERPVSGEELSFDFVDLSKIAVTLKAVRSFKWLPYHQALMFLMEEDGEGYRRTDFLFHFEAAAQGEEKPIDVVFAPNMLKEFLNVHVMLATRAQEKGDKETFKILEWNVLQIQCAYEIGLLLDGGSVGLPDHVIADFQKGEISRDKHGQYFPEEELAL